MPRIADRIPNCVVYIYCSTSDARTGEHSGGSGFIAQVPLQEPDWSGVYVVTNKHVVKNAKTPVIRINRKDGNQQLLETEEQQWLFHENGDDIAAFPLDYLAPEQLDMSAINIGEFVDKAIIAREDIGIGDDVFMAGRFIGHDGRQRNVPALRFGNIAMSVEKIISEEGIAQESFLVETRSLPGYSGSPVFLYSLHAINDMTVRDLDADIEAYNRRLEKAKREDLFDPELFAILLASFRPKSPYLLGIDWCHIHSKEYVRGTDGKRVHDGLFIKSNSGMAGVIPAWKIAELLNCEELKEMRRAEEETIAKKKRESSVSLDSTDEAPKVFTREDFEAALRKVSKRIEPSESDEEKK